MKMKILEKCTYKHSRKEHKNNNNYNNNNKLNNNKYKPNKNLKSTCKKF